MISLPEGLKAYLRVPFVMIVWVMETYTGNRDRMRGFLALPRARVGFKVMLAGTLAAWFVVALMSDKDQGDRLSDALKDTWSETKTLSDERKAYQENLQEN